MRLLVDGMNVIGTRADGWWRDRDAAMARLVDRLERWSAASGDDVTVVFEAQAAAADQLAAGRGRARSETGQRRRRRDRAPGPRGPDPRSIRVVTSDHLLGDLVRGFGATVEPAGAFRDRIESA